MKDLEYLGDWQDPIVPDPGAIAMFLEVLEQKSAGEFRNVDTAEFITALRVAFKHLGDEEYFSDVGRSLVVRQLCHAMLTALDLKVNIAFEEMFDLDSFDLAVIHEVMIFRDGGSLQLQAKTSRGEDVNLFLQVAWNADDSVRYNVLYPCEYYDLMYHRPIPKNSPADVAILRALDALVIQLGAEAADKIKLSAFIAAVRERDDTH